MGKPRAIGICHICGNSDELSFEHSPPKKAFNDSPLFYAEIESLINGEVENPRGKIQQRGAGAYTLCERCNNLSGKWYGGAFVEMAKQGMIYLQSARASGRVYLSFAIYPLRVIKQVVCMLMSANAPSFQRVQPELARFVLNRDAKHIPDHIRIYTCFTASDRSRSSGVSAIFSQSQSGSFNAYTISEVTFPPFGFVATFECKIHDDRLVDITHFADNFDYDDRHAAWLLLPVLPIFTYRPGDYRSRDEVLKRRE
jgi:hypothetical protein